MAATTKPATDHVKVFATATDKATKGLVAATTSLNKLLETLNEQVETVEILSEEIQVKQEQRNLLDKELGIKVREHEAELALQIRENEEKVVLSLLSKTGRADMTQEEAAELRSGWEEAKESKQEAVDAAVASERRSGQIALGSLRVDLNASHSVETAELKATINSLQSQMSYLSQQVATYKQMLDDERNARVASAEASARAAEANRPQVASRN